MNNELEFYRTTMPDSRPADYYLGYFGGSVFIDFNYENERIVLRRISFDGYGCCNLNNQAIPMNDPDSRAFKEIITAQPIDQFRLTVIIKRTILHNRKFIWEDALNEYDLI